MICAEVGYYAVVLSVKQGLTNSAFSKFEYLSCCISVVLSCGNGCFFFFFSFLKALNFFSLKLGQKRKIQMLMWTLSTLSLQIKHEEAKLNRKFYQSPWSSVFWSLLQECLWLMRYPVHDTELFHTSQWPSTALQFWYLCISAPCWLAPDQEFTHFSIAQNVPPFLWTCFE